MVRGKAQARGIQVKKLLIQDSHFNTPECGERVVDGET
jgi:hypothetical protein